MAVPEKAPKAAPALGLIRPLIALNGNPAGREDAVLAFKRLREAWPRLKVAASAGADRLFHGARRPFAGFAMGFSDPDFMEQVGAADAVLLLNPTMNVVAKMASLIADCPPSVAAFTMIEKGRPVYLVTRPLEKTLELPGVGSLLREKLSVLERFGVKLVPHWETLLTDAVRPGPPSLTGSSCGVSPSPARTATCDGGGREVLPGRHPPSVAGSASPAPAGAALKPPKPGDCMNCPVPDGCAKYCPELVRPVLEAGAVRVQGGPGHASPGDMARLIDHTLLKADATEAQVAKLCDEAAAHSFMSVCVNPGWVRFAATRLRGTVVKVCTVVGFPLGATSTEAKVCETRQALRDGADEIDMVIDIGALKNKEDARVEEDIRQVVRAAEGRVTKVILETSLLTDEEKVRGCILSKRAGAHFVKTSTGFSTGGATVADIALMRKTVGPDMGVKASGGVRDREGVLAMVAAGATRIGASASVAIVTGAANQGKGY